MSAWLKEISNFGIVSLSELKMKVMINKLKIVHNKAKIARSKLKIINKQIYYQMKLLKMKNKRKIMNNKQLRTKLKHNKNSKVREKSRRGNLKKGKIFKLQYLINTFMLKKKLRRMSGCILYLQNKKGAIYQLNFLMKIICITARKLVPSLNTELQKIM